MPRTKDKQQIELESDLMGQEEETKDTPNIENEDEEESGMVDAVGFDDEVNPFGDKWEI